MANKRTEELKGLTEQEVQVKVEGWRRELFGLRLNSRTSHVKDYSQFKTLRKNIARGLTFLNTQQFSSQQINDVKEGQ